MGGVGRTEIVTAIAIQIVRFVDDYQPGFVECRLVDAEGQPHLFVEKVPIVSTEDLWLNSSYPQAGAIACEVEAEWTDDRGRSLAKVNTERPWSVASTTGATRFVVLSSQVAER